MLIIQGEIYDMKIKNNSYDEKDYSIQKYFVIKTQSTLNKYVIKFQNFECIFTVWIYISIAKDCIKKP